MKKTLLLLMAIAITSLAASAATKYEINIAGTEVNSDNASYIVGVNADGQMLLCTMRVLIPSHAIVSRFIVQEMAVMVSTTAAAAI